MKPWVLRIGKAIAFGVVMTLILVGFNRGFGRALVAPAAVAYFIAMAAVYFWIGGNRDEPK